MKTKTSTELMVMFLFMVMTFIACQTGDLAKPSGYDPEIAPRAICGQVDYTAPSTVPVGQEFNITALVSCGRIGLDRAYILAGDGITRIYTGLNCSALLWEEVVAFECASTDVNVDLNLDDPGIYTYRTKHNPTASVPCGGSANNCSGFTGNAFCCFQIEATSACADELSIELACDDSAECGRTATITFTALEDGPIVIQGGLTAFTSICSASATGGLLRNLTHSSVVNSNANVTRWEGEVEACEEYTITIEWTRYPNSQGNIGIEAMGTWTATRDDIVLASAGPLSCN